MAKEVKGGGGSLKVSAGKSGGSSKGSSGSSSKGSSGASANIKAITDAARNKPFVQLGTSTKEVYRTGDAQRDTRAAYQAMWNGSGNPANQNQSASDSKGKGGQSQYAQEASQGQSQQAQQAEAQESKFSDEANKGQSQNAEQQEQNKYSREANQEAGYTPEGNYYDPEADAGFVDLFAKDEDPAKTLAETAEGKQNGDDAQKGSAWAKQRADEASTELADLQADRLRVSELYQNGEPPSEQTLQALGLKTLEEYDDAIEKAQRSADYFKKLAETGATDAERDALLGQYNQANTDFETYAGYAVDPLTAAAMDQQEATVEGLETQLKEKNRELGNTSYTGLADYARGKDFVENWQGERGAQYGAALGTGAEWLGNLINNTSYTVTDPETGEEREVWNLAGKGDALQQWGADVFQSSKALNEEAQQDWADVTEGMSGAGQFALSTGKSLGNVLEDQVVNMMLPGSGQFLMTMRAAGGGALEQDTREGHNDLDSRAGKALLEGSVAFLSNRALGGLEGAYGRSELGKTIARLAGDNGLSPMMKRALNTEGFQEVAEYGLSYIGDRIFGLVDEGDSFWGDWDHREAAQNYAVGYFLGFLLNAGAGEMEVTTDKAKAAGEESLEAGMKLATGQIDQEGIVATALSNPDENARMTGKQRTDTATAPEAGAEPTAEAGAPGTEGTAPTAEGAPQTAEGTAPAPQPTEVPTEAPGETAPQLGSMDTGAQTETHQWVRGVLSNGAVSEQDISRIMSSAATRQAFADVTGISLEGRSFEEARNIIGMAGSSVPKQSGSTPARYQRSDNEAVAAIQERGTISQREASRLLRDPEMRAAFEEAYGISLEGKGETRATQEIIDAVNRQKTRERATGQYFEVPAAEPGNTEGPGEAGSRERREYERDVRRWQQAQDDVVRILTGEDLSRKDATRLMNDNGLWQAFEEVTGINLNGKPRTELNVREAVREAKADPANDPATLLARFSDNGGNNSTQLNAALPEMEYDEAAAYRDSPLEKQTKPDAAQAIVNAAEGNPGQNGGNTPESPQNAVEGGLNRTETNEGNNPLADTVLGESGSGTETSAGRQEGNTKGARAAEGTGPERASQTDQSVINRLEGEGARDPRTYLGKSDMEVLQGALNRLNLNGDAETEVLMTTEMWNDEQVQMANMMLDSLFADSQATGNRAAYDAFAEVYAEHGKQVARALRQFGQPGAGTVRGLADLAKRHIAMMRAQTDAAIRSGKMPKLTHEQINAVEQTTNDNITKLSGLEAKEAEMRKSGATEEQIWNTTKDEWLDTAQELVAQRNMGLLVDDVLGKNKRLRAKNEETKTFLRRMLADETPEYIRNYVKGNSAGLETDIEYLGIPTPKQAAAMVNSFHKMCMLFSSGTAGRNIVSNIFLGTFDWTANNVAGAPADALISLFTGHRARGVEAGALSKANWGDAGTAVRRSILEIAANMDMNEDGKYINGTSAFSPYNPFTRVFARASQALNYALNTTDAFSVGMAKGSAERAAMRVGGKSGMTEDTAAKIGQNEADFRTLKDKNVVTEKLTELHQALDLIGFGGEVIYKDVGGRKIPIGRKGGYGLGSFNVPFVNVPANLKLKALQYSPANIVYGAVQAKQAADLAKSSPKNSDAYQESFILQNEASGRIGRGVTGTALLMLLSSLMKKAKEEGKEWFRDWDQEDDPDIKAQNRAEGKSGQQINTRLFNECVLGNGEESDGTWQNDDRTMDISSIEPLDQFLAMASIMSEDENASTPEAYLSALYSSTEESLTDMPCLQAMNDFSETLRNNQVYDVVEKTDEEGNVTEERVVNKTKTLFNAVGSMAGSAASGFIPGPVRHYAQVRDEYQRDTTGETAVETAANRLKLAIPGLRETLPVKTDSYGRELTQGDETTRKLNTYSPFKFSQIDQSETSAEVERLRNETGVDLTPDRYGPKSFTFGSGKDKQTVRLTAEESQTAKNERGQAFDASMQELMNDPVYQLADKDTQAAMASEVLKLAKDDVKVGVAEGHDIEYESKYADYREMEDPVEVLAAQTSYSAAKKAEDWDAVDELLKTIRRGDGKISQEGMDYLISKDSKINYYTYLADKGVPTRRAKEFDADMEELYTSEKREAPRSTDYLRTATSGKYSSREADAIMSYERDVSAEALDRYQSQIQYQLQQAGKAGMYSTIAQWAEDIQAGDKTMDDFRTWARNGKKSGLPLKQANEIADVLSTWTSDRHAAGKTVAGIYEAARSVGYTPEQVGIFFEHLDTNYNGSYSKSEIDAAVAWALGYDKTYTKRYYGNTYRYYTFSGAAKKLRDGIRERIGK